MLKLHAAIYTSFIADALALGAHWEYDQQRIADTLGNITGYVDPTLGQYHPTKNAGDLSHYGDQTLELLHSVTLEGKFDIGHFASRWKKKMTNYDGYIDRATRDTLQNLADGKPLTSAGATSGDFSAVARIAPLLATHHDDLAALVVAARAQTLLTHDNVLLADGAEFFARVVFAILHGAEIKDALEGASDAGYGALPVEDWLAFTYLSADEDAVTAIARFGQSCGMRSAFHGVVHLLTRYADSPQEALIENVMAGGDSCARGLTVGMILGAKYGDAAFRPEWLSGLKAQAEIAACLEKK